MIKNILFVWLFVTTFFSCVNIDYYFLFVAKCLLWFCVGKLSCFLNLYRSFYLALYETQNFTFILLAVMCRCSFTIYFNKSFINVLYITVISNNIMFWISLNISLKLSCFCAYKKLFRQILTLTTDGGIRV